MCVCAWGGGVAGFMVGCICVYNVSEHGHVTNNAFRCLHGECVSVCLCAVDSKDLCAYMQGVQKDA